MFLSRSAASVARRAAVAPAVRRGFVSTVARREFPKRPRTKLDDSRAEAFRNPFASPR